MPSDSVASFLDHAREHRLLPADELDALLGRPEAPGHSLAALADYLAARGTVTPFQAERLRSGRGRDLTFAGYAVTDELGPCPGGTAYRAVHPSLRTPLVLRRLAADWLGPADNLAAYLGRARDAAPVTHPHLAQLLDAGVYQDEPFAVLDPAPGADLESLVRDIGPMPVGLACGFARQAAEGLAAAHARGLAHGGVRPGVLVVSPLVQSNRLKPDGSPLFRPTAGASATVFELGLVPRRRAADVPTDERPYLPPERADSPDTTPAGDVFALGATLAFLLTAAPPTPDSALRPDVPTGLLELVREMTSADPAARPGMPAAAARLAAFATPAAPPPAPVVDPATSSILPDGPPAKEQFAPLTPAEPDPVPLTPAEPGWGDAPLPVAVPAEEPPADPFGTAMTAFPTAEPARGPRAAAKKTPIDRAKLRMWFLIGAGFWGTAALLWVVLLNQAGCFGGNKTQQPGGGTKSYRK